ncbi:hypothetical protein CUC76_05035 [Enterobacteriaceae bacterium S05]|nr:hypothetical protein CUC76_05035 [Enterobacteriaceae bacterium S05]KKJ16753.1 hypothetical protein T642_11595 [Klebsiella pneumoniae HE12]
MVVGLIQNTISIKFLKSVFFVYACLIVIRNIQNPDMVLQRQNLMTKVILLYVNIIQLNPMK